MLSSDFDIIAITETWLKPSVQNNEFFDSSYLVYRCDRSEFNSLKCRGGGVLVAVKSKYKSECLQLLNCDHLEVVVVKIKINTITLFIFCIYIPSGSLINVYDSVISAIETFFETVNMCDNDLFLLLGDFNLPNCNWVSHGDFANVYVPISSGYISDFLNSLHSFGLFQINNSRNFMDRILDLAFVNRFEDFNINLNLFPLVKIDPFHVPFEISLNVNNTSSHYQMVNDMCYDFKQANFHSLNSFFLNLTWTNIFKNSSIDTIVENLYEMFSIGLDLFVKKKVS